MANVLITYALLMPDDDRQEPYKFRGLESRIPEVLCSNAHITEPSWRTHNMMFIAITIDQRKILSITGDAYGAARLT